MRIRAMLLLTMFRTTGTPSVQSTRDPYESGGPKPYLAQLCSNLGKIWKKCGQDLRPIWGFRIPYETGGQKPYEPQMGCS